MYILYFQVCEKEKETEDKKPTKASKTDSAAALKTDSAAASGEFKLVLERLCKGQVCSWSQTIKI
jgi:hypothetical protein